MDTDVTDFDFHSPMPEEISPLHQISPKQGQTIRIAMLDEYCKPKAAHYHWYREGFYRCNSPKDGLEAPCCAVRQSWTCVSLALQYLNANDEGEIAMGADIKFRVGYVSLARTAYVLVSECHKEAPGCDIHYYKSDGYQICGATRVPAWKLSPQAAEVEAAARKWSDGKKLIEKLGKKLTDTEWIRFLKTGSISELEDWD